MIGYGTLIIAHGNLVHNSESFSFVLHVSDLVHNSERFSFGLL